MRVAAPLRTVSVLALLVALLAGCASTRIASTWKDAQDSGPPVKKLIVFVVTRDPEVRRFAENQAVRSLPAATLGVPSHTVFGLAEPDMEKMRAKLQQEGFEAAVVARLVSIDKTTTYHPPRLEYLPDPWPWPYYRSFYWYYPHSFTYLSPPYMSETTRVIVETMLYRLPEGRPVWSAVSETTNPDSTLALVDELIRILGGALRQEGLIAGMTK